MDESHAHSADLLLRALNVVCAFYCTLRRQTDKTEWTAALSGGGFGLSDSL